MTDERRRGDEQRLARAQEIAHATRERQAELQLEPLERSRVRSTPSAVARLVPDDVC
jgi:tRNA A37 N6-isopentenylltransferase MiaA